MDKDKILAASPNINRIRILLNRKAFARINSATTQMMGKMTWILKTMTMMNLTVRVILMVKTVI